MLHYSVDVAQLTLFEELFLVCINDATSELAGSAVSYLPYGLAGAILAEIALSARPRKLTHWIVAIGARPNRKRIAQRLEAKHVLRVEKKHFLFVIPYDAYPERDASAKFWVKQALRGAVLGGEKPEPRTVALLGVLRACRLLDLVFTKDERKAAARRIDTLAGTDLFGEAVAATLSAVDDAAVMAMAAADATCT